jgi:hypothetical protein
VRTTALALAIAPFVVLAALDLVYHRTMRTPHVAEDVLHVVLAGSQVALVVSAFRGDVPRILLAAVVTVVLGALDEFGFHHALPARESDLHAKAHFALFGFVVVALVVAMFPDVASAERTLRTVTP